MKVCTKICIWLGGLLLAAGVILTAAGVSGEALKRKSGGEKSKLAKMMSEWRW